MQSPFSKTERGPSPPPQVVNPRFKAGLRLQGCIKLLILSLSSIGWLSLRGAVSRCSWLAWVGFASCSILLAQTPTDPAPASAPVPFRLSALAQAVAPDVARQALVVSLESNRFTFLPPPGWRVLAVPDQKQVRLAPSNTLAILTLTFDESHSTNTPLTAETLRSALLRRYPGAVVTGEAPATALGQPALGFDLEWRTPAGVRQAARVAVAPFQGGYVEAALKAPPSEMARFHHPLNTLLLSFRRSAATGRLALALSRPE